ncbi:MAG: hypothetical protein Q7J44_12430 [Pseudotabrizicola sp.]|uniref:hypothetical protein n=1 Tax=Pseudotabrizicola sp. TaxID=2939647 RepID=UPI00272058BE|nr:hypothetical protein [Pseudotabrizicola sp.]MDO9639337.1 hypothetical protein [Pseudotabrizicola sp.]
MASSHVALAQDLVTYETVGVWDILIDPTIGNGCLINATFEDGSDVRIGFAPDTGFGYLLALNDGWEGVEDDVMYPVSMDVDGAVYEGEGKGIHIDGLPGVDIEFDSADFLMDVATKQTLTLSTDAGEIMSIDLTDSLRALEEAIACQEAQG